MVSSIVLTGEYTVGIDKNERFQIDGKKMSLKDVPFVRYRLAEYTAETVEYIKRMKGTFKYSAHMAEVTVKPGIKEVLEMLSNGVENLILYIYIPVTDTEVVNGLGPEWMTALAECEGSTFDRVMIKDNSTSLHLVSANNIKRQISNRLGVNASEIGICSSPLSFNSGEACLTAVKARELSAMYLDNDECALPTANHECMECCGCIRYMKVCSNLAAPITVEKGSKESSNKSATNKTTVKTKVNRNVVQSLF
jgi:hypothetical protein